MKGHSRATSSRCQRNNVSGVTIVPSSRSAVRHCLRLRGKVASLGIREDDATITKAAAKQAALGNVIVDHRRLLPMQPPSNDHQQKCLVTRPLTLEVVS
jgi:hypothetical protein